MSNLSKHLQGDKIEDVLFVSGSRCQIYPIDNDTLKGEMLTPWMNDKSLLIDKYDARCWLSDISCFDHLKSDLPEDYEVEVLCDRERYLDLNEILTENTDNDHDKEIPNRIGIYSSVEYSYDEVTDEKQETTDESSDLEKDDDIPYQVPPDLKFPEDIDLPKTEKQAAKIEKTATFIAAHGIQMEILLKTKQGNNKKFHFLSFDDKLNPFYKFLLEKIKNAEYIPAKRQLFHLTKTDNNASSAQDATLSLPKVDISNTAYYKLINKYRSSDNNDRIDSQTNGKSVDCDNSQIITDPKESNPASQNEIEDAKEKLYKSLYEQYYAYYYNYYYQLHNNSPMLQESNLLQIQEDSKSLAINAAAYAAKAGVEQFQKDQDEMIRADKIKQDNIEKKKQLCLAIKYVDYVMKHGSEFEYLIMSKSDKLKFLDPDNQHHSFYQYCLSRAKKSINKCADSQNCEKNDIGNPYHQWEDYIKKLPSGNIQSAPKLVVESLKSHIIAGPIEQRLVTLTDHISNLINAEEIGRRTYYSQQQQQQQQPINCVDNSHLQANRKRKAAEFLEKINKKNIKQSIQKVSDHSSHIKSSLKRPKKRKNK